MSEDGSLVGFFQTDSTFSTQWISTNFITYFHSGIGLLMLLQLMWKKGKGEQKIEKKKPEKTCGHIVSTDHHLSYIYTFTQHSWAYFQNQSFQSLQILCPACFLILMTTTKLSEIGASILNNFYLCHEANFWIYC